MKNTTWSGMASRLVAALVAALAFALPAAAGQSTAHAVGSEGCLACGATVAEGTEVPVHRGREVPICEPCLAKGAWEANRDVLFAQLQPKGALFAESEVETGPVLSGWFWFGAWVLTGLICAAASAYLAVNRAQPPATWFFAGLVGNVAALFVLLFVIPKGDPATLPAGVPSGLAKVPTTREPRPCTSCGTEVHPSASKCSSCGTTLTPLARSEVQSAV